MSKDDLKNLKNPKLLADRIPANSALMKYERVLRERVVQDIIADKPIRQILDELHKDGYNEITDQQLRRIRRNIIPIWNRETEPRIVFGGEVEEVLDTLEYLLEMEFKRIVEIAEEELESKDNLYPIKHIDPDVLPAIHRDVVTYYQGDLPEERQKALFSFMERRGRNNSLFKEIQSYHRMVAEYLTLRQQLGDESIKLKKPEKSATIISIDGGAKEMEKLKKKIQKKVEQKVLTNGKKT